MEKINKKRVMFIGLNRETPMLLHGENGFDFFGVAMIELFQKKTYNPANIIFKYVYGLRINNKLRFLETSGLLFWNICYYFSSGIFKEYGKYLSFLCKNKIKVIDIDSHENIEIMKNSQLDLIVVNACGILPEEIILIPKYGTVNIHPSKLPKYRGSLPTLWILKNGDNESAVTYILLNKGIDSGKIIAQHLFEVNKNENWLSLEKKVNNITQVTLVDDLKKYLQGDIRPTSQNNSDVSTTAKYADYLEIKWCEEKAKDIYNKVNLYPYLEPELFCFFNLDDKKIKVKSCELTDINMNVKKQLMTINYLNVLFFAKDGIIKCRLFKDFSFKDSLTLMTHNFI